MVDVGCSSKEDTAYGGNKNGTARNQPEWGTAILPPLSCVAGGAKTKISQPGLRWRVVGVAAWNMTTTTVMDDPEVAFTVLIIIVRITLMSVIGGALKKARHWSVEVV